MQTLEPNEYVNNALLVGLLHVLVSKGVLTRDDLDNVVTDAIGELDAIRDTRSVSGAIEVIKSLLPKFREYDAGGQ